MARFRAARFGKFFVFAVVALAAASALLMWLWNMLLPALFGWKLVSFWQALGLLVLSRLLFGRFGRPGGGGSWRAAWARRWAQMTPEEREQLRARLHRDDCWGAQAETSPGADEGARPL